MKKGVKVGAWAIGIAVLVVLIIATVMATGEPAHISITTTPVAGPIYIDGIRVDKGDGSCEEDVDPGYHIISFGKVPGYEKPEDITVNLTQNETFNRVVVYAPTPKGRLEIRTEPEGVNGEIFINDEPVGRGYFEKDYFAGTVLRIKFGDVQGYETPKEEQVKIIAGQTIPVIGYYIEIPRGTLVVRTTPIKVEFKVNGQSCKEGYFKDEFIEGEEVKIFFNEVDGYYLSIAVEKGVLSGNIVTVPIVGDETVNVTAHYDEIPKGFINVTAATEDGKILNSAAIYVDGDFKDWGSYNGSFYENTVHNVSFGLVDSYYTPESEMVTVVANETQYVNGTYKKISVGWLNISTIPPTWIFVYRGENLVGRAYRQFFDEFPDGTELRIEFEELELYWHESLNITIEANKNISKVINLKEKPKGTVRIYARTEDGKELNVPVYLDGGHKAEGVTPCEIELVAGSHTISVGRCDEAYPTGEQKYETPGHREIEVREGEIKDVPPFIYQKKRYPPKVRILPEMADKYPMDVEIKFSADADDIDGRITEYIWEFSDGSIYRSKDVDVVHAFHSTGIHKIKLSVRDDDGLRADAEKIVEVFLRPEFLLSSPSKSVLNVSEETKFNVIIRSFEKYPPVEAKITLRSDSSAVHFEPEILNADDVTSGSDFSKSVKVYVTSPGNYKVWYDAIWFYGPKGEEKTSESFIAMSEAQRLEVAHPVGEEKKTPGFETLLTAVGIIIALVLIVVRRKQRL